MKCVICENTTSVFIEKIFDDRYGYPEVFQVLRCDKCKSFLASPRISDDRTQEIYTSYYPRKNIDPDKIKNSIEKQKPQNHFKRWFGGEHRIHRLLDKAQRKGIKVLDIGCGDGRSLMELEKLGYEAYGIEVDKNVSKVVDVLGLNIYIGDIRNTAFNKNFFDIIIINQVIEHTIKPIEFIEEVEKFLAKKGEIIISTPNSASIFRLLFGSFWINWHIPYHQEIFSTKSLIQILEKKGLMISKKRTVSPTGWITHQINRFRFNSKLGLKNPFWTSPETVRDQIFGKIFRKMIFIVLLILSRIADIFGYGDCLIIFAKRN